MNMETFGNDHCTKYKELLRHGSNSVSLRNGRSRKKKKEKKNAVSGFFGQALSAVKRREEKHI